MRAVSVENVSKKFVLAHDRPKNLAEASRALLVAVVCVLALAAMAPGASVEQPKVTVVFRYDDYSAKSPIAVDRGIIEILKKRHAKAVFAVIPFRCAGDAGDTRPQKRLPLTPQKVSLLKEAIRAGVIEVALHGYSHQTIRTQVDSEFAGEQYDRQLSKIRAGKRYLEHLLGVRITSFVPPYNQYDENTCRALSAAGVKMLSAGLEGPAGAGLRYLPITGELHSLRAGVEDGLAAHGGGQLVVALFHPSDFRESADPGATTTLAQFDELVGQISSREGVRTSTFADLAGFDLSAERYEANLSRPRRLSLAMLLPRGIRDSNGMSMYTTTAELSGRNRRVIALALGFYGAVVLVAGAVGFLAARFVRIRPVHAGLLLLLGGPAAFAYLMVHAAYSGPGSKSTTAATFAVAAAAGLLAGRLRCRRQEA